MSVDFGAFLIAMVRRIRRMKACLGRTFLRRSIGMMLLFGLKARRRKVGVSPTCVNSAGRPNGAVDSQRPSSGQIVEVDTDEDVVLPAQGGGSTKQYGDDPPAAAGKTYENADFGDEEELASVAGVSASSTTADGSGKSSSDPVQPFAGLPELPDDLSDAVEMLKLSILRHKTAGWDQVDAASVQKYLDAMSVLIDC